MARKVGPSTLEREVRGSTGNLHLNSSVQSWLDVLGLSEYLSLFSRYRTLEDIINLTEMDIRDLGVRNGGHRARMISNLVMIRESTCKRPRPLLQKAGSFDKSAYEYPTSSNTSPSVMMSHGPRHPGSSFDPRAHSLLTCPWYHGSISRQEAEHLVSDDGKFLVRDSSTQLSDFVLTARFKGTPLHFVINKITLPGQTKVMYHFEEEPFESVPELIEYYTTNAKPVTTSSGAVISIPVVRSGFDLIQTQVLTPGEKESMKYKRTGSEPLLNFDGDEQARSEVVWNEKRHGSMPSIGKNVLSLMENNGDAFALDQGQLNSSICSLTEAESVNKTTNRLKEAGPPKPSRLPTVKKHQMERPIITKRNQALYEDDGKDYSDYDQVRSSPKNSSNHERLIKNFETVVSNSLRMVETTENRATIGWLSSAVGNNANDLKSHFDNIDVYNNSILPAEAKPLDMSTFNLMKSLIVQGDAVMLARHLTAVDLDLVRVTGSHDFGFGVTSGLELMTLPQGHYLRQDIVERHFSMRFFVSVMVLYSANISERVDIMNCWMQIAHELLNCFGNLFGFSAVMEGLLCEQVLRLEKTWLTLDQRHGTTSSLFAGQMCNFLKSLNGGATNVLPLQNITIPHILPLVELLQLDAAGNTAIFLDNSGRLKFDLDSLMAHLDMARVIAEKRDTYRKTSENLLAEAVLEKSLIELLSPRTHLKFLWGSKGVRAPQSERFGKFEKVLSALSEKAEPQNR